VATEEVVAPVEEQTEAAAGSKRPAEEAADDNAAKRSAGEVRYPRACVCERKEVRLVCGADVVCVRACAGAALCPTGRAVVMAPDERRTGRTAGCPQTSLRVPLCRVCAPPPPFSLSRPHTDA
jgi:hypothetical protein